jgi:hypothetical protein
MTWVLYAGKAMRWDPQLAAKSWDLVDARLGKSGFRYVGHRVHVTAKKGPPSRAWVQHVACGRIMPKLTPYPKAPRCPWCQDLPDRSMAAIGHLPGFLYLLAWDWDYELFVKCGIGLADGNRIASQQRQGAQVLEVRQSALSACREAEVTLLRRLAEWRVVPRRKLTLSGDTECLHPDAPVQPLKQWFAKGQAGRDVTRAHR